MAYELSNTLRSGSILRVVDAGTVTIQTSNLAYNANETVSSFNIRRIFWSTNGSIQIARGGVNVLALHNAGEIKLDEWGHTVANNSTANISVTITTGGSCVLELSKDATYATPLTGI